MAKAVFLPGQQTLVADSKAVPVSSRRYDLLMGFLALAFIGGLYLDGWAHAHGKVDQTFFTPWHAVLYSMYFLNGIALVTTLVINHAKGYSWKNAMPAGYGLSLFGIPFFAVAGVADLFWHTLFGFEVNLQTLLSPTHLLLAGSGLLIQSGPIRASLRRQTADKEKQGESTWLARWQRQLPLILSLTAIFSLLTFFTQFAHPYNDIWTVQSDYSTTQGLGIAAILWQSALFMGLIFLIRRSWPLPLGTMTFLLTVNCILMSFLKDGFFLIPAMFLAGLVSDLLLWGLRPGRKPTPALRLFSFVVPLVIYLCYFAALMITDGTLGWSLDLWLGASIMAGLVGLGLSYLVILPPTDIQELSGTL